MSLLTNLCILQIDGVDLPDPATYTVSYFDLDASADRANGYLVRNRMRSMVYKIEMGWNTITLAEVEAITSAVEPVKVSVRFYAATNGEYLTKPMYVGDRTAELIWKLDDNNAKKSYWNLSFGLVEY